MSSLRISGEVRSALDGGAAVVALESTLLAHGLPPAARLPTARALESAIRGEGAVPATIAVIDGELRVGLDEEGLERITSEPVKKASLRDLAVLVARRESAATTVATTMAIAARAGIRVFATGGIGGVHRGAEESFDESADLFALARYPVAVVSAGAKAVLDLPRTLERLETLGVPVIGYRTRELPAFYCASSGLPLEHSAEEPAEIAAIMKARFDALGEGGILVVQPPPPESAQDPAEVERLIGEALAEAERAGIRGSKVTPFLLAALDRRSAGSVVKTNVALVTSNAVLAARIARH